MLALYLAGFAEGTGDHLRWMAHGGIHAYAGSYPAKYLDTGPWLITAFGVFVFASAPALLRLMRPDKDAAAFAA